jgi:lipopolysaccharide biosynthesis protein
MLKRYRYNVPKDFDPNEYLIINEDLKAAGVEPFRHYAKNGKKEGRLYRLKDLVPEDFDREAYLLLNQDVLDSNILPEIHYYRYGQAERRLYKFYLSSPKLNDFDEKWYLSEYPEVASFGMLPFEHYKKFGRYEGRHPKFDHEWYKREYLNIAHIGSMDPLQHYRQIGKAEFLHPALDPIWYALIYPDVANSQTDPYEHYHECGRREGRHPAFNRHWYQSEYLSDDDNKMDAFNHFMNVGRSQARHPAFHHEWYRREYPDIQMTDLLPYAHYAKYGRAAGYKPAPGESPAKYVMRVDNFPAPYSSEYQPQEDHGSRSTDIKAIAFYLPQFHEVPENNLWWGAGFTEWTNTKQAKPLFPGHYQPREPHSDIGYYDLSDPDVLRRQAKMAREHGIHGFCFYHYWFSGKKLLEKPIHNLLENKDIDINFTICWANENWTRTWDGSDQEILIKQEYLDKDPINFIKDVEVFLTDQRYIRVNGCPVILVYKPHIIPEVGDVFAEWRRYWLLKYGCDLQIWCIRTDPSDYNYKKLNAKIDGLVEFPPHVIPHSKHLPKYTLSPRLANIKASGNFYDYQKLADDMIAGQGNAPTPVVPLYRGVMLGWDNTARRKKGQSIWYGFDLHKYFTWLSRVIDNTRKNFDRNNRFIFINAWNEWAEGTYLEPDKATGYAALNTTSRALYGLPFDRLPTVLDARTNIKPKKSPKILIHLHVYHVDLAGEFTSRLEKSDLDFDIVVTSDTAEKLSEIRTFIESKIPNQKCNFVLSRNIGRDIGPILLNLRDDILAYDIFGHFHTKKSHTVQWGDMWRTYLLDNLMGSPDYVSALMGLFEEDETLGLIRTPTFPLIARHVSWGNVQERCAYLMREMGLPDMLSAQPHFPVGNMFWARVDAIRPILQRKWTIEDFEQEADQLAETLPHCVERLWDYIAMTRNYSVREILSSKKSFPVQVKSVNKRSLCLFVHYSQSGLLEDSDLELLRRLTEQTNDIFIVSNSDLGEKCRARASLYVKEILIRPNKGLDFAAWRDLINYIGWEKIGTYDEVIFVNNSTYGPVLPLDSMFSKMRAGNSDFWGVTAFPRLEGSNRPEAIYLKNQTIPRHIQSYFVVFNKKVIQSRQFYRFWSEIEDKDNFMDVVASYEARMTEIFENAGFEWDVYIPEAEHMQLEQKENVRYNAPYNSPFHMLLLKCPLIKKRAWDYNSDEMKLTQKLVDKIGYYPAYEMDR